MAGFDQFIVNSNEQLGKVQNSKKGTESGQKISLSTSKITRKLSKTHADYWYSRLRKRTFQGNGKTTEIANWQIRFKRDGRECWFNLGTPNQAAASKAARDIYHYLMANGWDETLAKFKRGISTGQSAEKGTVGEYLAAVQATGKLNARTFLNYQTCFKTIIAGIFGMRSSASKYDYKSGGNKEWVQRINKVRLGKITPDKVRSWQRAFVARAVNSPVATASAKRTANSYVRCARSLFARRILDEVKDVSVPSILPFDRVELFENGSMKYQSRINAQTLIAAAKQELKESEPEAYKAFLLGLFGGMRKAEIDLVEWRMVDWEKQVIHLENTKWLHLKTDDSAADVELDSEVIDELRFFMPKTKGIFILQSERAPHLSTRPYYRCAPAFNVLNEWLRQKGVTANKPLHELRKEVGAIIASNHGIYAASAFLRHSDITTTARHYADQKKRISTGLGKLLESPSGSTLQG